MYFWIECRIVSSDRLKLRDNESVIMLSSPLICWEHMVWPDVRMNLSNVLYIVSWFLSFEGKKLDLCSQLTALELSVSAKMCRCVL